MAKTGRRLQCFPNLNVGGETTCWKPPAGNHVLEITAKGLFGRVYCYMHAAITPTYAGAVRAAAASAIVKSTCLVKAVLLCVRSPRATRNTDLCDASRHSERYRLDAVASMRLRLHRRNRIKGLSALQAPLALAACSVQPAR